MISTEYVQMMAHYNAWQNNSLVAAADGLDEAERVLDRGSFFGSIMRTFSHLLWGDTIWLSRFEGSEPPEGGIPGSPTFATDWSTFKAERAGLDQQITTWAKDPGDFARPLRWFSDGAQREVEKPWAVCVTHFFNHQTHHRGQIHAMLTAAGARPGATDLPLLPDAE